MKSHSDSIDISTLKSNILSQYQASKSHSNHDHDSQEIIAILGGIDKIVTDYLTSNEHQLSRDQLIKLQKTLNSNKLIPSDPKSKIENDDQLIYTFNIKDTYNHYLFGDNIASNIIHYTYNKYLLIFFVVLSLIYWTWFYVFGLTDAFMFIN